MNTKQEFIDSIIAQLSDEKKETVDKMLADTGFRIEITDQRNLGFFIKLKSDNCLGLSNTIDKGVWFYIDSYNERFIDELLQDFDDRVRLYIDSKFKISVESIETLEENIITLHLKVGEHNVA